MCHSCGRMCWMKHPFLWTSYRDTKTKIFLSVIHFLIQSSCDVVDNNDQVLEMKEEELSQVFAFEDDIVVIAGEDLIQNQMLISSLHSKVPKS